MIIDGRNQLEIGRISKLRRKQWWDIVEISRSLNREANWEETND
jgi:hypothetical protein